MYPILLQLGPLTVYSLWIFMALGIFFSLLIVYKLSRQRLVKLSFLSENSLLIFLSGLIMARLVFMLYNLDYFIQISIVEGQFLEPLYIWDKGLNVWGGLLGIFLSLWLLAKKDNEDFRSWTDILAVAIFFGMTFAYLGAFLDGRSYGSPTDLPWGVMMEPSQYAIPIHPVQLYAALYSLLIGLLLFHLFNHDWFKKPGIIALSGLTIYSLLRFLEEFLRGDEALLLFDTVREGQIWSFLGLSIGTYMLYRYFRNYFQENS